MQANLCSHKKLSGEPCGRVATHGSKFCHFHNKFYETHAMPGTPEYDFPILEDKRAIQLTIQQLMRAIANDSITREKAWQFIRIINLANRVLHNPYLTDLSAPDPEPLEIPDCENCECAQQQEPEPLTKLLLDTLGISPE